MNIRFLIVSALLPFIVWGSGLQESPRFVQFPSMDGVTISADYYSISNDSSMPLAIMFHQAGYSRGEYKSSVGLFLNKGFNALVVDLRSGKMVNGVVNETQKVALQAGKSTRYIDALQDIEASLIYGRKISRGKLITVGSSYSAGLLIHIAGSIPGVMDGLLLFSPGEYFFNQGKASNWVQSSAANINIPVFVTSSKQETYSWQDIFEAIPSSKKLSFVPKSSGQHGARVLWNDSPYRDEYWATISPFLSQFMQDESPPDPSGSISVK